MRIEIWADVVCPWAYIGKRRLERALAAPETAGLEAEVVWRPFRIDPTAPARAVPLEEALRDPLMDGALARCAPGLTPAENRARVSAIAAEEGLGPPWGAAWRASSHDAHRLLALALDHGGAALQNEVAEQVMKAHFVEGLDISDRSRLKAVAERAGFPEGGPLLDTDAAERAVRESLLVGKARGIATSPTFVVGDRALAGAQAPETIAEFLTAGDRPRRALPEEVERLRYAESLLDRRDPLGALELLRPLLDEHGRDTGVRLLAARAYFASAQLRRARETLEELVAESPDDSYARLLLGRTLQRQGLADEAAVHLRLATTMSPGYA
ncbi:DsbA family oxidoreductase [Thermostaphylospora chromogena]|uniref:Predicted dithiol-disulfide isomerase, DsbA family n=1 Tax=Thermostaphylospora chromogena TaxID=35622 RepID=A0A1H1GV61_9ACTN|nr:DsbA family oxidoreductase [Thermostaphylospora chromogena]SDR17041.1 Predicted dithiol-disulfide isomerase, DsbA family [Thermostaphylospora chromogena]